MLFGTRPVSRVKAVSPRGRKDTAYSSLGKLSNGGWEPCRRRRADFARPNLLVKLKLCLPSVLICYIREYSRAAIAHGNPLCGLVNAATQIDPRLIILTHQHVRR